MEDASVSHLMQMYSVLQHNLCYCKLQLLVLKIKTLTLPDTKTTENHSLDVVKKYVETYSSSIAARRDPEKWVQNQKSRTFTLHLKKA